MQITANGKKTSFDQAITVKQLLDAEYVEMQEYVTVQVNERIIPSGEYASFLVQDGDVIEFLYYMGGGQ